MQNVFQGDNVHGMWKPIFWKKKKKKKHKKKKNNNNKKQ